MTGRDWRERAACRDVDPEVFFPITDRADVAQVSAAKTVCSRCPVRAECLSFALVWLPHGIAGGLTPVERRRLRPVTARRMPPGLRRFVIDALAAGESVSTATLAERGYAARTLRRRGEPVSRIRDVVGGSQRQVERWLAVAG